MMKLFVCCLLVLCLFSHPPLCQANNEAIGKNNEGVKLLNRKDCKGAIKKFGEALEIEPRYSLAIENRAIAWNRLKQHKKALEDYNLIFKLHLDNYWTYTGRANTYELLSDYKNALADYDRAIDANQGSRSYLLKKRAKVKLKLHDKVGAKEDLERAKNIDELMSE